MSAIADTQCRGIPTRTPDGRAKIPDMDQELLGRLRQALDLVEKTEAEALRLSVALRHGGGTEQEITQAENGRAALRVERMRLLRELKRFEEPQTT